MSRGRQSRSLTDRRIFGAPAIEQHGAAEHLHQLARRRLGQRRGDGAPIAAHRLAQLHLDQLVLLQRNIERAHQPLKSSGK